MFRLVGVLAAVLLCVSSSGAHAHAVSFETRIKQTSLATEGGDVVSRVGGVVTSRREACLGGREVVVTYGDERYGSDTTDASGDWSVEGDGPTGKTYRFLVRRERLETEGGHRHVCSVGSSTKVLD